MLNLAKLAGRQSDRRENSDPYRKTLMPVFIWLTFDWKAQNCLWFGIYCKFAINSEWCFVVYLWCWSISETITIFYLTVIWLVRLLCIVSSWLSAYILFDCYLTDNINVLYLSSAYLTMKWCFNLHILISCWLLMRCLFDWYLTELWKKTNWEIWWIIW